MPPRYAYLHGFASSAQSRKGLHFKSVLAARGMAMLCPDLNCPSFEDLSYQAIFEHLDGLLTESASPTDRWRLMGSSMGGYLAARWAERHPERVESLILLCPGFAMARRWPEVFGSEAMAQWKAQGRLPIPDGQGVKKLVHYGLVQEAEREPEFPLPACPSLIIHGTRDETVPFELSLEYVEEAAVAGRELRLVAVDDDHALLASLKRIEDEAAVFWGW